MTKIKLLEIELNKAISELEFFLNCNGYNIVIERVLDNIYAFYPGFNFSFNGSLHDFIKSLIGKLPKSLKTEFLRQFDISDTNISVSESKNKIDAIQGRLNAVYCIDNEIEKLLREFTL